MITAELDIDPRTCSERALLEKVQHLADLCGWMCVHFGGDLARRAWYDATGFPDLLMVHISSGTILWVELKTATGKLSAAQTRWRDLLVRHNLNYHLWRPADWPDIVACLDRDHRVVATR